MIGVADAHDRSPGRAPVRCNLVTWLACLSASMGRIWCRARARCRWRCWPSA